MNKIIDRFVVYVFVISSQNIDQRCKSYKLENKTVR